MWKCKRNVGTCVEGLQRVGDREGQLARDCELGVRRERRRRMDERVGRKKIENGG